jgi:ribonuclease HII
MDLFSFDRIYRDKGYSAIAGIDEAGRGPWAGPVVAAAVILPPDAVLPGVNDSKKLTPQKREQLFEQIQSAALGIGVEVVDHTTIDAINILQATYRAMRGALQRLPCSFDLVLVDGWPIPGLAFPQWAITGGDAKSASIAAASIIAKVTRDRIMVELSAKYPAYLFDKHKGYGTPEHQQALAQHGPCPIHRQSFAPVQKLIAAGEKR